MRRRKHWFGSGADAAGAGATNVRDPSDTTVFPGAQWAPNWNVPLSSDTVNVDGHDIPYYIAPGNTSPYDPASLGNNELPAWVKPVAIGGAIVVGLTLLGVISWKA